MRRLLPDNRDLSRIAIGSSDTSPCEMFPRNFTGLTSKYFRSLFGSYLPGLSLGSLLLFCLTGTYSALSQSPKGRDTDVLSGKVSVVIDPYQAIVNGTVSYTLKVLRDTDSIAVDARDMNFSEVMMNGKRAKYDYDGNKLILRKKLHQHKKYELTVVYRAQPARAMYFAGWNTRSGEKELWTQGQGKYTSHWLPSFDDMTEKVAFDLTVTFDKKYDVIANGSLAAVKELGDKKVWSFQMDKPMSSYLLAMAIGAYKKKVVTADSGVPIALFYKADDERKFEPTYRYSKEIFDFLEREIGVRYPWDVYKQVPVKDFLYAGMENTSVTIFSDSYVIDSTTFVDKNYVNVNAHELAHQWFGNMVTEVSGEHHWLHEGFATYYALLAEKEIFGDDYFYNALYESAKQLKGLSDSGKGESLLDPKAGSLTFYQKGAWALHILRGLTGDENFRTGVKNYLNRHAFKNVMVEDFLSEIEQSSGMDLTEFRKVWLEDTVFPVKMAFENLKQNNTLNNLIGLKSKRKLSNNDFDRFSTIDAILDTDSYYTIKQEAVLQLSKIPLSEAIPLYKKAFATEDIKVRQTISIALDSIPLELKSFYEGLLSDKSYTTVENALFNLWRSFPDEVSKYLDKTEDLNGFNNKNIRMLWLTLAIITEDYNPKMKTTFYEELSGYTSPGYTYEVRQNAFIMLNELQAFTDDNLKDLVNASLHHSWQFAKFSRQLLTDLLNDLTYKIRFNTIISELDSKEQTFLKSKL